MPKLACFSLFCSPCDFTIYSPYMWLICTKGAKLSSHPLIFNTFTSNLCGRYMTKTGALYRKSQNWLVSLGPLYGFLHPICMILPKLFIVWTKIGCFTHSCGLLLITSLKNVYLLLLGLENVKVWWNKQNLWLIFIQCKVTASGRFVQCVINPLT